MSNPFQPTIRFSTRGDVVARLQLRNLAVTLPAPDDVRIRKGDDYRPTARGAPEVAEDHSLPLTKRPELVPQSEAFVQPAVAAQTSSGLWRWLTEYRDCRRINRAFRRRQREFSRALDQCAHDPAGQRELDTIWSVRD